MTGVAARSVAALAALLALSCRGVPLPEAHPVNDAAARDALVAELLAPVVPATMVQRWVLAHAQGESFFTLYVRLDPPGSMHMAVLSDLGGTLASGTWTDGKATIDQGSALPSRLAGSILSMLAPVYLPGPPGEYELVRLPEGTLAIRRAHAGTSVLRWPEGPVTRIAAGRGRTEFAATVTAWGVTGGVRHPASLRLEDMALRLDATVDVVRFELTSGTTG